MKTQGRSGEQGICFFLTASEHWKKGWLTMRKEKKQFSSWVMYSVAKGEQGSESHLIAKHAQLVRRIAQHLMSKLPPCVQTEDLMQAGMIGLLEAAKHFDETKGASFETYASIRVRGAMLDEIRKNDWVPRSVHRNTRRILDATRRIENETGRDARDADVAASLNISLDEYHHMVQDTNSVRVFGFEEIGLKEDAVWEGISDPSLSPLEGLQFEDFRSNLAKGIAGLPERERLVLSLYYQEELNLRQVGEILGVSESRASQIHSQAMIRLQSRLKEWVA